MLDSRPLRLAAVLWVALSLSFVIARAEAALEKSENEIDETVNLTLATKCMTESFIRANSARMLIDASLKQSVVKAIEAKNEVSHRKAFIDLMNSCVHAEAPFLEPEISSCGNMTKRSGPFTEDRAAMIVYCALIGAKTWKRRYTQPPVPKPRKNELEKLVDPITEAFTDVIGKVDKAIPKTPLEIVAENAAGPLKMDEEIAGQIARDHSILGKRETNILAKYPQHVAKTLEGRVEHYQQFTKGVREGDKNSTAKAFGRMMADRAREGLNPSMEYAFKACSGLTPLLSTGALIEKVEVRYSFPTGQPERAVHINEPSVVFFVNGIQSDREQSTKSAQKLADHLQRPVGLIYNASLTPLEDLAESILDRAWPITSCATFALNALTPIIQSNRTTKEVTYLLVETKGRLSIVTHSQGSLIMRNALIAATRFKGGKNVRKRVAWVAAGLPLSNREIPVKPQKFFMPLTNKDDLVANDLGVRVLGVDDLTRGAGGHAFNEYIPQIRKEWLWPVPAAATAPRREADSNRTMVDQPRSHLQVQ